MISVLRWGTSNPLAGSNVPLTGRVPVDRSHAAGAGVSGHPALRLCRVRIAVGLAATVDTAGGTSPEVETGFCLTWLESVFSLAAPR